MKKLFAFLMAALIMLLASCGMDNRSASVSFGVTDAQIKKAVIKIGQMKDEILSESEEPYTKDDGTNGKPSFNPKVNIKDDTDGEASIDLDAIDFSIKFSVELSGEYKTSDMLVFGKKEILEMFEIDEEEVTDFSQLLDLLAEGDILAEDAKKMFTLSMNVPMGKEIVAHASISSDVSVKLNGFSIPIYSKTLFEGKSNKVVVDSDATTVTVKMKAFGVEEIPLSFTISYDSDDAVAAKDVQKVSSVRIYKYLSNPLYSSTTEEVFGELSSVLSEVKKAPTQLGLLTFTKMISTFFGDPIYVNSDFSEEDVDKDGSISLNIARNSVYPNMSYYFFAAIEYEDGSYAFSKISTATKLSASGNDISLSLSGIALPQEEEAEKKVVSISFTIYHEKKAFDAVSDEKQYEKIKTNTNSVEVSTTGELYIQILTLINAEKNKTEEGYAFNENKSYNGSELIKATEIPDYIEGDLYFDLIEEEPEEPETVEYSYTLKFYVEDDNCEFTLADDYKKTGTIELTEDDASEEFILENEDIKAIFDDVAATIYRKGDYFFDSTVTKFTDYLKQGTFEIAYYFPLKHIHYQISLYYEDEEGLYEGYDKSNGKSYSSASGKSGYIVTGSIDYEAGKISLDDIMEEKSVSTTIREGIADGVSVLTSDGNLYHIEDSDAYRYDSSTRTVYVIVYLDKVPVTDVPFTIQIETIPSDTVTETINLKAGEADGTLVADEGFSSYEWYVEGELVSSGTSNTFVLSEDFETGRAYSVTLVVKDADGNAYSSTYAITLVNTIDLTN